MRLHRGIRIRYVDDSRSMINACNLVFSGDASTRGVPGCIAHKQPP